MMASKQQIDLFFNRNYDTILKETRGWVSYCNNATAEAEDYLADCYNYLIINKSKIGNKESDIKKYAMRFIIDSVKWFNSTTNKLNRRINNGDYIYMDEISPSEEIIDDDYQITLDDDYICKLSAIELYNQQAQKEDKIVYQVYANKGKRTVRAMAQHLNIRNTQSWIKICQMKEGIIDIYNNLKKQ